ncbi:MAG: hypothetical protein MPN21_28345 [Thermoanaerobaculia bacterium]|nr:hypothetical protein [Thermoanaerobaculia bacterium]
MSDNLPDELGQASPWWLRLGSLLPSDLRERVFEPCCFERMDRDLRAGRRWARRLAPWYALHVLVMTCGYNLPRMIRHQGRFTRLAKVLLLGAAGTAVFAFVILQLRYGYSGR